MDSSPIPRRRLTPLHWLFVALLVGLAIRVPALVAAQHTKVPGDQLQYSAQAIANADGNWFEQPFAPGEPSAEHPPMTSALLTPITWIVGDGNFILAQRLTVVAFGMANIVLLWLLGRRHSPQLGSLLALLGAIDVRLFLSDVLILSETFGVTLITLTLFVLWPDQARKAGEVGRPDRTSPLMQRRRLCVVGVLLGLLVLTRAELLFIIPLVSAWLWWQHPQRRRWNSLVSAILPALVAAAVLAPWIGWNLLRFEARTTLSTNDGFTLLGANCADTYYGDNIGGYSINCALAVTGEPGMDASEVSALRRETATVYAGDHLSRLPIVAAARFARQWEIGWVGRTAADSPAEGRPEELVLLGTAQWWLLGALAVVGARRCGRQLLALMLITPLVVTFAAVSVNAQWRLRVAVEPPLLVLAGIGMLALMGRRAAALGDDAPGSADAVDGVDVVAADAGVAALGEHQPLVHPDR
jgi:4-amino-4-deoxy-L-arabinose transferase-like glycosyltransferase